jgi:hypothetical protein
VHGLGGHPKTTWQHDSWESVTLAQRMAEQGKKTLDKYILKSRALKGFKRAMDWEHNSRATPFLTPATRSFLPVLVNGKTTDALPDTGAARNVMSLETAMTNGLIIDKSHRKRHTFENAVGRSFRAIGETLVHIAFADALSPAQNVLFSVVEKCAAPLILGRDFLASTHCLTRHAHRLVQGARGLGRKIFRVAYLESSAQRLRCTLNARDVLAAADTGSDVDLISLRYARYCGWKTDRHETGRVILSDGTVQQLEGSVELDLEIGVEKISRRFYVLDGLKCDVLLGDDSLQHMDVWNDHGDAFVDIEDDDAEATNFWNIEWVERFDNLEAEVDALVEGRQVPVTTMRLHGIVKRFRFSSKTDFDRGEQLKGVLWNRLNQVDQIEQSEARRSAKRLETLTADARVKEQQDGGRRTEQWKRLRRKIIDLYRRVQADGTLRNP